MDKNPEDRWPLEFRPQKKSNVLQRIGMKDADKLDDLVHKKWNALSMAEVTTGSVGDPEGATPKEMERSEGPTKAPSRPGRSRMESRFSMASLPVTANYISIQRRLKKIIN